MIRLLIIGRRAREWADAVSRWTGERFEVDVEQLPAAGIRNFEGRSPDAVAIAEPSQSRKMSALVAAIRERPLGQLVPILVLGEVREHLKEMEIDAIVSTNAGGEGLLSALAETLDADFEALHRAEQSKRSRDVETRSEPDLSGLSTRSGVHSLWEGRASVDRDRVDGRRSEPEERPSGDDADYVIESLDVPDTSGVAYTSSLFRLRDEPREDSGVFSVGESRPGGGFSESSHPEAAETAHREAIQRKLRDVRHEDYFTILAVGRSVDASGVREAYDELSERFEPDNLPFRLAHEWEDELEEIADALDDALAVLGDAEMRARYLEETTRK